jgi:hypothetical protein
MNVGRAKCAVSDVIEKSVDVHDSFLLPNCGKGGEGVNPPQ